MADNSSSDPNILNPYAIHTGTGRLVYIGDVSEHDEFQCPNPDCGQRMVAKLGQEIQHHFAHYGDVPGCGESALHHGIKLWFKETFDRCKQDGKPFTITCAVSHRAFREACFVPSTIEPIPHITSPVLLNLCEYDAVALEKTASGAEGTRSDILFERKDTPPLAVEVHITNLSREAMEIYRMHGLGAIVIQPKSPTTATESVNIYCPACEAMQELITNFSNLRIETSELENKIKNTYDTPLLHEIDALDIAIKNAKTQECQRREKLTLLGEATNDIRVKLEPIKRSAEVIDDTIPILRECVQDISKLVERYLRTTNNSRLKDLNTRLQTARAERVLEKQQLERVTRPWEADLAALKRKRDTAMQVLNNAIATHDENSLAAGRLDLYREHQPA